MLPGPGSAYRAIENYTRELSRLLSNASYKLRAPAAMALSKDSDCSVIFSVTAISLRNEFDISTKNEFGEKYNYFVINKGGGAKRVRVTVSKKSDAVSSLNSSTLAYKNSAMTMN